MPSLGWSECLLGDDDVRIAQYGEACQTTISIRAMCLAIRMTGNTTFIGLTW
jgi:hypothetical protein